MNRRIGLNVTDITWETEIINQLLISRSLIQLGNRDNKSTTNIIEPAIINSNSLILFRS